MPPGGREAIYANAALGNIGGMAAFLSGTAVHRRALDLLGAGTRGGHQHIGETNAAWRWDLPEGVAGSKFDTFLLLANPFTAPATVDLSMQIEGYGQITLPPSMRKVVPAYGRLTLYMPEVLRQAEIAEGLPPGSLASVSFATTVRVFAGPPIVAEHAIYWQRDGSNFWRAGSAAFGTPR